MTPKQVVAGMIFILSSVAGAESQTARQTAVPSQQAVAAAPPQRIVELEGTGCVASNPDYPIVWTFDGLKGQGKFDISVQEMDIDSSDGQTLVARRTSYSGGRIGSGQINGTAIYTGHISGTHITGTAVYQPVGRPVTQGPWCGEIENPKALMPVSLAAKQLPTTVPPQLLECELDQYCDGLWSFDGSSGNALWPRNPNVKADLTVESFTPDKIVIRRTDTTDSFTAVYTGRLDGNRISGTVVAQAGGKSATYGWTATIPATSCKRADKLKLDAQEAMDVGRIAQRFNLLPAALDCYTLAALDGDSAAAEIVANIYREGIGTKSNPIQALYWSQLASGALSSSTSNTHAAVPAAAVKPPVSSGISVEEAPRRSTTNPNIYLPEAEMLDFPPPHATPLVGATLPAPSVDLNGIWEMESGTPRTFGWRYMKVEVFQLLNIVEGITLQGHPYPVPGEMLFAADFDNPPAPNPVLGFANELKDNGNVFAATVERVNTSIVVDNANQFHIDNVGVFHRLSSATAHEVACDPKNSQHISAKEALYRGYIFYFLQIAPVETCWNYVAAMQGSAEAEANYAHELETGRGVPKDIKQAVWWFQQSAMQGYYGAETNLTRMFKSGEETLPLSRQRYNYWRDRAISKDPANVHDGDDGTIPAWALETSGPCDPTNPTHADASRALVSGRVAYEARALQTAACWFTISAAQKNLRAQVYLGILNLYGFGVPINAPAGFAYMKKAAEAGDVFGMAYLSNMYRDGMGTMPDMNQASAWFNKLYDGHAGTDAWDVVMGRGSIAATLANELQGLPDHSADIAECVKNLTRSYQKSEVDAKADCEQQNEITPLDILKMGKASSHNSMLTPEEVYPEFPHSYGPKASR